MSFFERPDWGEAAVLVHCEFRFGPAANCIQELQGLAESAGAQIKDVVVCERDKPSPKFFVGSGFVESLASLVQTQSAQIVIFNHDLSPAQGRNLEQALCARVVDRTGLILDIFAQRARTYEGKLQVELAQLKHLLTKLVRGWTHLERQKGGIGLRGPGETQLETDRRLVRKRINQIEQRLRRVSKQRAQNLRARARSVTPLVALVGYTNAGKSTLFNRLTESEVLVADQLFATLDTTHRRLELAGLGSVVLSDTVGFMRNLPHHLVQAFRGTLEEIAQADLILEVVDASECQNPIFYDKLQAVDEVIVQVGAANVPRVRVFNKVDLIQEAPRIEKDQAGHTKALWLSATVGVGIELMGEALVNSVAFNWVEKALCLSPAQGQLRAAFYRQGAVVNEVITDQGEIQLTVKLLASEYAYIIEHFSGV